MHLRSTPPPLALVALCLAAATLSGCATTSTATNEGDGLPADAHALVWSDAALYRAPGAEFLAQAYDFRTSERAARPGQLFVARVLGVEGDWYKLSTGLRDAGLHCVTRSPFAWSGVDLEVWVHARDLAPTLAAPLERDFADGTRVALRPGTPVLDGRPWVNGFHLPLQVESAARIYAPAPAAPTPAGLASATVDPKRLGLDGRAVVWAPAPWAVSEEEVFAFLAEERVVIRGGCGALELSLQGTEPNQLAGLLGALGPSLGQATVREGAPLFWEDGRRAGQALRALTFTAWDAFPGEQGQVCRSIAVGTSWRGVSGYRGDEVVVCARREDVSTTPGITLYEKPKPAPDHVNLSNAVDLVFAATGVAASEQTTTPPGAPSLVSLASRYQEARAALQAALKGGDAKAIQPPLKKLVDLGAAYREAAGQVTAPPEALHVVLAQADLAWNLALDLNDAPIPVEDPEGAAVYREVLVEQVAKFLVQALEIYRVALKVAEARGLTTSPIVDARVKALVEFQRAM